MTSTAEQQYRQGMALQGAGDFPAALAAFDAALKTAPQVFAVHFGRGNALVGLRRLEEAAKAYEHCLALDPYHPGSLNNHAMALVQLQRWDDALRALDR